MAEYFHGVSTRQVDTSVSTPVTADSGIAFVVGAAPAHTVGGSVNDPIMCQSYAEAVAAMGYSDNWENYPICEAIYAQFKLYGVSPVVAGDMWDAIAYKTLGDEAYTDRIMKLNPEYRRLFVFPAGIVLTIPEPESQVAAGLPPWKRGTA